MRYNMKHFDWLIELGFNGTFSTVRLYRALKNKTLCKSRIKQNKNTYKKKEG